MKGLKYGLAIWVMIVLCGQVVQAQVLSSCDKWANYSDGAYVVYNNL